MLQFQQLQMAQNASSNKVINTSHLLQIAGFETEVKINKLFVPRLLNLLDNQTRNFLASDDLSTWTQTVCNSSTLFHYSH